MRNDLINKEKLTCLKNLTVTKSRAPSVRLLMPAVSALLMIPVFCLTRWAQGLTSSKAVFVDETTACYSCGNHIIFLDVETQKRKVLQSPGHGIGVFTASGLCKTLAFSEQRRFPSIFVYRYPELSLRCELKGAFFCNFIFPLTVTVLQRTQMKLFKLLEQLKMILYNINQLIGMK